MTEVAAAFIKIVPNITGGAVAIVRQSLYNDRDAIRAVPFVLNGFVSVFVPFSGSFLDDPVNVVIGNIGRFCFGNAVLQPGIGLRVRPAALFDRYGELTADFCENLGFGAVGFSFFLLILFHFEWPDIK